MTDENLRQLESALHNACHAARLTSDATERLAPGHSDHDGWNAAAFAADLTEKLASTALAIVEASL